VVKAVRKYQVPVGLFYLSTFAPSTQLSLCQLRLS
jgi:hypothetical protein